MARYYFNVRDEGFEPDLEGRDIATLEEAKAIALEILFEAARRSARLKGRTLEVVATSETDYSALSH